MADFKGFKIDGKEYPWGDYVTAGRQANTTAGDNSTAEGIDTQATATASHAEGKASQASNFSAHAEGFGTLASGYSSHAEGGSTQATQNYAHAEGYNTIASSIEAHAEGTDTRASSSHAHAEGYATVAGGLAAHAEGFGTTATHQAQHVFGQYNALDPSQADEYHQGNYVEIVGNGTADNARSNARTLDWSGNEVLAGKLTVGSAPTNNMDVATKQYVDNHATAITVTNAEISNWVEDYTYTDFCVRGDITVNGITDAYTAFVNFDSNDAIRGCFASFTTTANNTVSVYANILDPGTITIPLIIIV